MDNVTLLFFATVFAWTLYAAIQVIYGGDDYDTL